MRNLVIATTVFLVGGAAYLALLLSLPQGRTAGAEQSRAVSGMPMGGATMASTGSAPASRSLTIQHILRGCHTWSNGKAHSPMMRLTLKPGGKLSILDQDIDAHRLMQLSGPMRLTSGGR